MSDICIKKYVGSQDVSAFGAFTTKDTLRFEVLVPRRLGVSSVTLRICRDACHDTEKELIFCTTDWVRDVYSCELDISSLTEGTGLLFYTFVCSTLSGNVFLNSVNNVDVSIADSDDSRFNMLIYDRDFKTPDWIKRGCMYHIFVDRFYKGEGKTELRTDCRIDPDWDNGVPQYAARAGDPVKNNVFFGGNLYGVCEKLDYLESLGITAIYLSPVFEAYSNHKYDTGDYLKVDSAFGGDGALEALIKKAKEKGIRIILDGVFNHTGDDSRYFDKYKRYGTGAVSDGNSPYRSWYSFKNYPDEYESWWGIPILPRLDQTNPECRSFFTSSDGVAAKYINMGIGGWRLDVADELPDIFLDELRKTVKESSDGEGFIVGEVWENAATKSAYGKRRSYFLGKQLDSVMNYPLRNAIIDFVRDKNATSLYNTLTEIYSSYPKCVCDCLMNIVGTHDTERILTVLAGEKDIGYGNACLAGLKMSPPERERGIALLKLASVIQYTVYGFPSLYYGDEAGLEGYHDPFCRLPYPWGREEKVLLDHYRRLGEIRKTHGAFNCGAFRIIHASSSCIAYARGEGKDCINVALNRDKVPLYVGVRGKYRDLLTLREYDGDVCVPPDTALILENIE